VRVHRSEIIADVGINVVFVAVRVQRHLFEPQMRFKKSQLIRKQLKPQPSQAVSELENAMAQKWLSHLLKDSFDLGRQ
jgi:hypothetical protein